VREKKGQKVPKRRKRLDTAQLKLEARGLSEKGYTDTEIAAKFFPREYRNAITTDPNIREKFGELAQTYRYPPYDLTGPEAERKAACKLGLDLRSESKKLKKLIERIRYLRQAPL